MGIEQFVPTRRWSRVWKDRGVPTYIRDWNNRHERRVERGAKVFEPLAPIGPRLAHDIVAVDRQDVERHEAGHAAPLASGLEDPLDTVRARRAAHLAVEFGLLKGAPHVAKPRQPRVEE